MRRNDDDFWDGGYGLGEGLRQKHSKGCIALESKCTHHKITERQLSIDMPKIPLLIYSQYLRTHGSYMFLIFKNDFPRTITANSCQETN